MWCQASVRIRCLLWCTFRWGAPDTSRDSAHKHLAIALNNGLLQLMASQADQQPIIVDTMVRVACMAWNAHGTVLAVAGASNAAADDQDAHVIRFFSDAGTFLHQMKLPRCKQLEGAGVPHACIPEQALP